MDKYIRGKVLGKGSFGCAILVTNKLDNKNYVIKEIDISRMPKAERDASEQEAKLLMALNHPNIVRCIECFTHMNKLCIVMDWCSEGDLYGLIQKRRGQQLSEDTILDWLVQMCLGLKHVHDRKILHRDIKTQNVFMSSGGLLKLGDFGVSKVLNSTFQLATTAVGTPYYLSPEICQNRKYNQKSDIWSLGCVLYELATLKHAFEAPNMRALIQKIIKGSYPPMPATRSKELRDLCDRMLTLDWQKRPSINDILATPIMKARIQKFLSATLVAHEFSHTIIHGRPKPGQLVVGGAAGGPPAPPVAAGLAPSKFTPGVASAAVPSAGARPAAAPVAAAAAAARPGVVPAAAPARGAVVGVRASSNSPAARAPAGAAPVPMPAGRAGMGAAPVRPGAAAVPAPAANAALKQAQDAAAAARAKAAEAAKQREDAMMALAAKRAADAEANAKRELERAKQREVAALGAQREIERLKLEEQRRKLEADKARADAERRKREADRVEQERRAKAAEEARARLSAEEAKRARELEAKRKKAEEEARKKDAERAAKEKEREDMRVKIAAQRKEYQDRQAEAAKNRAVAEQQLGRGPSPEVQVMAGPRQPRRQWSPPRVDDNAAPVREDAPLGGAAAAGRRGEDALSAEQRRAVWEEQRAAADRNRRAVQEAERHGGIADFLGVPREEDRAGRGRQPAAAPVAAGSRPGSGAKAAAPAAADISPDARRAAFLEMRAAAERNRAQVEGGGAPKPATPPAGRAVSPLLQVPAGARPVTPPPPVPPRPSDPWAAKMARLEEERRKRELEILEFQKQHWQEVREARERNKRNIMAEVGNGGPDGAGGRAQTPPKPASAAAPAAPSAAAAAINNNGRAEEEDDTDFAAMLKDMQDVLMDDDGARNDGDDEEDDIYNDEKHSAALAGHFVLNGQAVALPGVRATDSLALKVEALRVYLEAALGTDPFLKVYRRLESLSIDDDEGQVSAEFLAVLGPDKLPYLQLVHQLIVCEENMHMEGA